MERFVRHFQEELDVLKTRLLEMGGLAEERVRQAVRGLAEREFALIEAVLAGDEPVNQLHIEIDDRVLKLLALHQPVAADLRAVMAAVKINTDLERVGDLAVNIAEAAKRYALHPPVKKLIDIPRMAEIAQVMLRDALDSYVKGDVALAQHVLNEDDKLDALKTQIFRELLTFMLQDPTTIEPSLDLILISRHLERIGDHATNVAEDVIFMVSARDVRHHAPEGRVARESQIADCRSRICGISAIRNRKSAIRNFPSTCPFPRRPHTIGAMPLGIANPVRALSQGADRPRLASVLQPTVQAAGSGAVGGRWLSHRG